MLARRLWRRIGRRELLRDPDKSMAQLGRRHRTKIILQVCSQIHEQVRHGRPRKRAHVARMGSVSRAVRRPTASSLASACKRAAVQASVGSMLSGSVETSNCATSAALVASAKAASPNSREWEEHSGSRAARTPVGGRSSILNCGQRESASGRGW